jgi:hypothetical protein
VKKLVEYKSKCQKVTRETKKIRAARDGSASKTKRTSRKSNSLRSGLSVRDELTNLDTHISIARGMLATISLGHKSDWIKKLKRTNQEHLRILLLDVMEEIWSAQEAVDKIILDPRPRLTV